MRAPPGFQKILELGILYVGKGRSLVLLHHFGVKLGNGCNLLERKTMRHNLPQQNRERIDVSWKTIIFIHSGDLGSHIPWCTCKTSHDSGFVQILALQIFIVLSCQSKVEYFDLPRSIKANVGWFQVTVEIDNVFASQ